MATSPVARLSCHAPVVRYPWQQAIPQTRVQGRAIRGLAQFVRGDSRRLRNRSHELIRATFRLHP